MRYLICSAFMLALGACGQSDAPAAEASATPPPEVVAASRSTDKYIGLWSDGSLEVSIEEVDGTFLIRRIGTGPGVMTGVSVLPLTFEGGQMKTNTYLGNIAVAGNEMYFAGVTFRRVGSGS